MTAVQVGSTFQVDGVTCEEVWEYLEQVEHAADWNTFVQSASSEDPPGVGREIDLRVGFLGLTFTVHVVATEADRPRRSVLESRSPFSAEIGMELSEVPAGVEVRGWFTMSPGRFFPVPGFVLRRAVQRQYDHDTELLRARLQELAV